MKIVHPSPFPQNKLDLGLDGNVPFNLFFSLNQVGFGFIQACIFLQNQLGFGLDGNVPSRCFPFKPFLDESAGL